VRGDHESFCARAQGPAVCGFTVETFVNESSQAIKDGIRGFFREPDRDQWLVFYYFGYGVINPAGRLYLSATDTRREHLEDTAIGVEFLRKAMDACASRRQVIILDCVNIREFQTGLK
jgi:uncharacterized caspase-like protein